MHSPLLLLQILFKIELWMFGSINSIFQQDNFGFIMFIVTYTPVLWERSDISTIIIVKVSSESD